MNTAIKNKNHKKQFDELVDMIWQRESDFTRWINEVELFHNNFTGEIHSWNDIPDYVDIENLGYSIDKTTLLIPAHFHKTKEDFLIQLINFLRSKVLTMYGDTVRVTRRGENAIGFVKDINDGESAISWISFSKLEGNVFTVVYSYGVFKALPKKFPITGKTKSEISIVHQDVLTSTGIPKKIFLLILYSFFGIPAAGWLLPFILVPLAVISIPISFVLGIERDKGGIIILYVASGIASLLYLFLCYAYLVSDPVPEQIDKRRNRVLVETLFFPSSFWLNPNMFNLDDETCRQINIPQAFRDHINADKDHQIFRDAIIGVFQEAKAWIESR
jgi:hypothetical protein